MRIVKFSYKKKEEWGVLEDGIINILKQSPFSKIIRTKKHIPLKKVSLLVPAQASKVVLVGLNYRDHARELNMKIPREPIIFLKSPTALIAHKQRIIYPEGVKRLDYEAELALVIKKKAKNIPQKKAHEYILGYTCLNDVTARDLQKKDGQWTRAKSFDTFCPAGPWIETVLNPSKLGIKACLNSKTKQDSSTSNFIFSVPYIISFISRVMTLLPGDIISTGTPPGIGKMQIGDNITIEIDGIGRLQNKVSL
ncbi:MAG: fumarylacetoacetate hydrolase family protein [PVC group bacterium]|nr:fumarylacetoacetate hydrolase family protein [PVC group bacterium]